MIFRDTCSQQTIARRRDEEIKRNLREVSALKKEDKPADTSASTPL
jgi:hypothetical protein